MISAGLSRAPSWNSATRRIELVPAKALGDLMSLCDRQDLRIQPVDATQTQL